MSARRLWVLLTLGVQGGCIGSFGASDGNTTAGSDTAAQAANARANFTANVLPLLEGACASCHGQTPGVSTPFMAANPDRYTTLMASGLVVPGQPSSSRLVTYGASASHSGPDLSSAEAQILTDWINLEPAPTAAGGAVATSMAFAPTMGDNVVQLAPLAPAGTTLSGATLTFSAQPYGASGGLALRSLTLVGGTSGVYVSHPLFVTHCGNVQSNDPVDTFDGVEANALANQSTPVGAGQVNLLNFQSGCQLSVHFQVIAAARQPASNTLVGGCKAVASFTTNAVPQLQARCVSCHGGANANAFNLTNLATPANQPTVCGEVKGQANVGTPAMSKIFTVVKGQLAGHPNLNVPAGDQTTFQNNITIWLTAEQ